jgi:hypothetical protein
MEIRESGDDTFLDVYRRVGADVFKDALYPEEAASA